MNDHLSHASVDPQDAGTQLFSDRFPDYSVVTTEKTRAGLDAILKAFGSKEALAKFSEDQDRVRKGVLSLFARHGTPPYISELAKEMDTDDTEVEALVTNLVRRDLLKVKDGQIAGAYTFTISDTVHKVHVGDHTINAMCAVDALGAGAMFHTDVPIDSECANCGAEFHISTAGDGTRLKSVSSEEAFVWSGMAPAYGNSEESLCTTIAFFDSQQCLDEWRKKNHPGIKGHKFTMAEGLEACRAIFGPTFPAAPSLAK